MNEKKNIERLFQEKFKDFEETPSPDVWKNINASLNEKASNKKRIIPIWWKLGGIAATLALLFVAGSLFLNSAETNISTEIPITHKEQPKTNNPINKQIINNGVAKTTEAKTNKKVDNHINENVLTSTVSSTSNNVISNKTQPSEEKANNKIIPEKTSAIAQYKNEEIIGITNQDEAITTITNEKTPSEETNKQKQNLLEIAEETKEEITVSEKATKNRWSISPNIAPVYYNSLSKGSPISNDFTSNSKEGNLNMSYGINLAYNVNNRLSIRSGVNNVSMSYNTNSVNYSPALLSASSKISTINFNKPATTLNVSSDYISSQNKSTVGVSSDFQPKSEETTTASMQQELSYIEVPMELKYRLVDKRFGINIIGGFSSLFLTNNVVSLQSDELTTDLGEANNINNINFSTNIGLGVDYQVSNKLLFNLEPMFKYQLNTFSREDGGFSPYLLGIYTGLSFKF